MLSAYAPTNDALTTPENSLISSSEAARRAKLAEQVAQATDALAAHNEALRSKGETWAGYVENVEGSIRTFLLAESAVSHCERENEQCRKSILASLPHCGERSIRERVVVAGRTIGMNETAIREIRSAIETYQKSHVELITEAREYAKSAKIPQQLWPDAMKAASLD